jgi:hypothetical protein
MNGIEHLFYAQKHAVLNVSGKKMRKTKFMVVDTKVSLLGRGQLKLHFTFFEAGMLTHYSKGSAMIYRFATSVEYTYIYIYI